MVFKGDTEAHIHLSDSAKNLIYYGFGYLSLAGDSIYGNQAPPDIQKLYQLGNGGDFIGLGNCF
jgi:hypothetical protein